MNAAPVEPLEITTPGVYDIPHDVYLADPVPFGSLSASGAKLLLPPSVPALYHWRRTHPEPPRDHFDLGTAAHTEILGTGAPVVEVDAPDWRSKTAREERDAIRAAGKVPLLADDAARVRAMVAAVREHRIAGALLDGNGQHEQTLVWEDDETGIYRRARLDCIRGRFVVDVKTAASAEPGEFARASARYDYPIQAAWYLDAAQAVGLAGDDAAFLFVVVEKEPPHLVAVHQLDGPAMRAGAERARQAIHTYLECSEADQWPGYPDEVSLLSLPTWYTREEW